MSEHQEALREVANAFEILEKHGIGVEQLAVSAPGTQLKGCAVRHLEGPLTDIRSYRCSGSGCPDGRPCGVTMWVDLAGDLHVACCPPCRPAPPVRQPGGEGDPRGPVDRGGPDDPGGPIRPPDSIALKGCQWVIIQRGEAATCLELEHSGGVALGGRAVPPIEIKVDGVAQPDLIYHPPPADPASNRIRYTGRKIEVHAKGPEEDSAILRTRPCR